MMGSLEDILEDKKDEIGIESWTWISDDLSEYF